MIVAKRYRIGNVYSKHLFIMDNVSENRILETPVEYTTLDDSENPEAEYKVDLTEKEAKIVRKDGAKIYSGFMTNEILVSFNRTPKSFNKML